MRQSAWLSLSDEKETKPRSHKYPDSHLSEPLGFYLVELLFDAGIYNSGFSGVNTLSWSDLKDWQEQTQQTFTVWEIRTIRKLSQSFCSEINSKSVQPPVMTEEIAQRRSDKNKAAFLALANQGK